MNFILSIVRMVIPQSMQNLKNENLFIKYQLNSLITYSLTIK